MAPYMERLILEKRELDARIERLQSFMAGDVFVTLPEPDKNLMRRQIGLMTEYSGVVAARLTSAGIKS